MIIDSHVHLFFEGSDPEAFFIGAARAGIGFFNKKSGDLAADISTMYETQLQPLSDKNGDKLVAKMNEAGIDKAVVLPLDAGQLHVGFHQARINAHVNDSSLFHFTARTSAEGP